MKNPSLPSRIGSATSYIARVPTGLSKIEPNIQILNTMKPTLIAKAINAIVFAVVFEMNKQKSRIDPGTAANAPNLTTAISLDSMRKYHIKMKSAMGSFIFAFSLCFLSG